MLLGMIKYFYQFEFRVEQLHCKCGQHGTANWVYHGAYFKTVCIRDKHGNFREVRVCLKRYMCLHCHRTITAFPWWLVRGCRFTLPTIIRLMWELNVPENHSIVHVATKNGIEIKKLEAMKATYERQIMTMTPEGLKNRSMRAITIALFGTRPVAGMERLAVANLSGLAKFVFDCEKATGLPFMQARSWWKDIKIRSRDKQMKYYSQAHGNVASFGYVYPAFYRTVGMPERRPNAPTYYTMPSVN